MLEIKTLEYVACEEIVKVFNEAFLDYFINILWTEEQLKDKLKSEGGRLDLSVGVFKNNKLVAFILHFIHASNGSILNYNGGTGVIPESRGKDLTSKMYDFILPKLKESKVDKMILEVLTVNIPAIRIYKRQGFKITRKLNLFNGKLNKLKKSNISDGYKVVELREMNWALLRSFWDYPPTWQNSISTMKNLHKQNISLGVIKNDRILGYIIYNPNLKRIHQMAVDRNFRNLGLGNHLLNYISTIENENVSCINIDARSQYFNNFLTKRGLRKFGSQYEMELILNHDQCS